MRHVHLLAPVHEQGGEREDASVAGVPEVDDGLGVEALCGYLVNAAGAVVGVC